MAVTYGYLDRAKERALDALQLRRSGFTIPETSGMSHIRTLLYGAVAARMQVDTASWDALVTGISEIGQTKFEMVADLDYDLPRGQEDILEVIRRRLGWAES